MSVTLRVTINEEKSDEDSRDEAIGSCGEYTFKQSEITIGRDESNDIHLIDPKRTISRNHARIYISDSGARIEDLKARNFTHINGDRLDAGEQRLLINGDTISIGDFDIAFFATQEVEQKQDVVSPVMNPFAEAVDELVQQFQQLSSSFNAVRADDKEYLLFDALRSALPSIEGKNVMRIVTKSFVAEGARGRPTEQAQPTRFEVKSERSGVSDELVDALIATIRDLIQIPFKFRSDFIGTTMMLGKEASYLHADDFEVTKRYLLDSNDSLDIKQRVDLLKKSAEEVSLHQVGMLEGYRAIVHKGVQDLLKDMQPDALEAQLADTNVLAKMLPMMRKAQLGDLYVQKIAELTGSDWTVAEQRVYRPIFVRAYLLATSSR